MAYVYSNAPKGKRTITNIYYNPETEQVNVVYIKRGKLITVSSIKLNPKPESSPPEGSYKVENLYFDPETGKLVVEYDNPEE